MFQEMAASAQRLWRLEAIPRVLHFFENLQRQETGQRTILQLFSFRARVQTLFVERVQRSTALFANNAIFSMLDLE